MTIEERRTLDGTRIRTVGEYGLSTSEAIRAYRDGRLERLPQHNRWKSFMEDHAAGLHPRGDLRLKRLCPLCGLSPDQS